MRVKRETVDAVFGYFVKAMGGHVATSYKDVNGYTLDYAAVYGGYVIEQINNGTGGVNHPFGDNRCAASEMVSTLRFAMRLLEKVGHPEVSK